MKRLLLMLVVLGVGALIAFLAVTRNMAQQRATKLDKALIEAEGKIMELEGDMQALEQELEEAKSKSSEPSAAPATPSSTTTGSTNAAAPSSVAPAAPTTTATNASATASTAALVRFAAAGGPGLTNQVRIEGTSSMHDWRVVGSLIGGSAELPQNLLADGVAAGTAIPAKASTFIPVRSLKSIKADGSPYSDAMDEILYGKLLVQEHPRITFTLSSLKAKDSTNFEASGQLGVAGKTNTVTMPVTVAALNDGRMQLSGNLKTKMTDFGIEPPAPGPIRTGDEVTLKFVWSVKPVIAQAAAK